MYGRSTCLMPSFLPRSCEDLDGNKFNFYEIDNMGFSNSLVTNRDCMGHKFANQLPMCLRIISSFHFQPTSPRNIHPRSFPGASGGAWGKRVTKSLTTWETKSACLHIAVVTMPFGPLRTGARS